MCQTFPSRCTHTDEACTLATRPLGHRQLGIELIACINNRMHTLWQKLRPVLGCDEIVHGRDHTPRMNVGNARLHRQHLGFAYGVGHSLDLSIDIRFGHMIQIDQCQTPDATACQCLSHPRANATDSHHGNMRCGNPRSPYSAIQTLQTTKPALKIYLVRHIRIERKQKRIAGMTGDGMCRKMRRHAYFMVFRRWRAGSAASESGYSSTKDSSACLAAFASLSSR